MSSPERKINDLLDRIRQENMNTRVQPIPGQINNPARPACRSDRPPNLPLENLNNPIRSPVTRRPQVLTFTPKQNDNVETEKKLGEIMRISGNITINNTLYKTEIKDMKDVEVLGNGTCGHVVKMRHLPSSKEIAVKQMRRSGNKEENQRIIMDIEVVLKSHDCKYIVKCLGCFIMEQEVWICMELMETCFDKLLKTLKQPIPENVLGKVTVATVEALSYLKDKHGVIHRDVKPSNILLDRHGNVKLCDFGISGRLVDSMAKTRSAGCAAYMAPERIEPDPASPDYDIRADVWSLGITLVELATGVFPYRDCKSDFEVLTKVIKDAPPTLPADKEFSPEFRTFVNCCLTKEKKKRPKYAQLKNERFIKKYETAEVNVEWFDKAISQANAVSSTTAARQTPPQISTNHQPLLQKPQDLQPTLPQYPSKLINGSSNLASPPLHRATEPNFSPFRKPSEHQLNISAPQDVRTQHASRLSTFHGSTYGHQELPRSYSPLKAYQAHVQSKYHQEKVAQPFVDVRYVLPVNRVGEGSPLYQHRRVTPERRWRSPSGSPLPTRAYLHGEQEQHGSTSPILLQRFYHQQKQQQMAREAEEGNKSDFGKKRFSSYIKLQLSGDRSGRSSRNQSPDPPPRLNRSFSGDQSPLAIRRNFLESTCPASPSLSRRYISPTPPIPPPRRLSESNSVPGSPQHLRTHFQYTPEPQRRLFRNNDMS